MKKFIISTLSAIALALPFGVGGLTLTAPATATHANAQSKIDHHFATCSVDVILRCAPGITDYVFLHGRKFGYTSGSLPYASNGADYKAYDWLRGRIDGGELHARVRTLYEEGFDEIFPDGQRPPEPDPLTQEELDAAVARLNHQQPGNTPQDRLEAFNNQCDREGGMQTQRFQFGTLDLSANQCRVERTVPDDDPIQDPTGLLPPGTSVETVFVSFDPLAVTPTPGDPFSTFQPPLFQVTPLGRFGTPGNDNPFTDGEERQVISDHRDRIIELQEEVTTHDEAIASMLVVQSGNSENIRTNTASIAALSTRVDTFADDIQKNKAGIALAYAFPSSGLNYNESFRLSGGAGYFEEEAAVAFGFTGRLSPNVTASGGVGLADGVTGGRVEVGFGW